jgi:hypothetical protein
MSSPDRERGWTLALLTALFASLPVFTALFFSCLVPTLFLANSRLPFFATAT